MWIKPNQTEVKRVQYLDEKGELVGDRPEISEETMRNLYEWMVQIRVFDEKTIELQQEGKIGVYAQFKGQEVAQVGSAFSMGDEDWIYPSYRESGVYLVRGMPMEQTFLYMMGEIQDATLAEAEELGINPNVFPVQIIIAAQCIHAVGGAWASKYRNENSVSVTYVGEGGTSEGDFHEAMNFAAVYDLPVIFFVQNNQWAITTPVEKQMATKTVAQKVEAYGIHGIQVDGNDVLAVYETMKEALALAREGKPVLIEAMTYRQGPHTTLDDDSRYREERELEQWLEKDPLKRMKTFLINEGLWDEKRDEELYKKAEEKVLEAYDLAVKKATSKVEDLFDIVYEEKTEELSEQQEEARKSSGGVLN